MTTPSRSLRLNEAKIEADPNLPIIRISRDFAATPAQLLRAHTDPALFVKWVGPNGMNTRIIEWDARDGGCWRYVAERDGEEYAFRGCFHQIAEHRLVQTFTFEMMPDDVALETMWFEELDDGITRLHAQSLVDSFEGRDAWLSSGMETGINEGYAKLDALCVDNAIAVAGTSAERFRRVADHFAEIAHQIDDEGWNNVAPCEGWVARDVVRHLVEWVPALIGQAGIDFSPGPSVDVNPAAAFDHLSATLHAALDNPAIAAREADFGPAGRMSVANAIDMLVTGDVFIHTWDLGRAVGIDVQLDPQRVAEMLAGMEPIDELLRSSGHYGPKVDVPDDADAQTRLIAFTGRRP